MCMFFGFVFNFCPQIILQTFETHSRQDSTAPMDGKKDGSNDRPVEVKTCVYSATKDGFGIGMNRGRNESLWESFARNDMGQS